MRKILTVIIPTYNMEKYLDRCLSSLVVDAGRMELIEVLVVNDGSKDRSSDIGHGYEERFPQSFRVIDKENGNYGSCINAALKEATGTYVKVLDADDYFDAAGFTSLIDTLVNDGGQCGLIISDVRYDDGNGCESDGVSYSLDAGGVIPVENIGDDTIEKMQMHALAYRLSVLQKIDYRQTEGISYTDMEWTYYPVAGVDCVRYMDRVVYVYNRARDGQTTSASKLCRDMWMQIKIIKRMLETYRENNAYDNAAQHNYMCKKLYYDVEWIYRYYLLSYPRYLSQKDLRDFDKLVQLCPDIYARITNTRTYIHRLGDVEYIREWQKRRSRLAFIFAFHDIQEAVSRLFHKIF